MPKFPGELEETLIRLHAAVAEKHFAIADAFNNLGGKTSLRFGIVKVAGVDEFLRLRHERFGDGRVRMSQAINRDATAEIQVAPARHVKNVAARAMAQSEVVARVSGQDVLLEKAPDGLKLILYNGRRWRRRYGNNFFHNLKR